MIQPPKGMHRLTNVAWSVETKAGILENVCSTMRREGGASVASRKEASVAFS